MSNELQTIEVPTGTKTQVHIDLKFDGFCYFVDIRRWYLDGATNQFVAGKKGLMLRLSNWRKVLPYLNKMVKENEDKT